MKKSFVFLTGMLVMACGSSKIDESVTLQSEEAVQFDRSLMEVPKKADDLNGINGAIGASKNQFSNSDKVGAIMTFLASDDLQGRDTGSEGIEKAAGFIENVFSENNIRPYFQTYRDELSNYDQPAFNVVGMVEGNDPELKNEFVIVGAHYDHIGLIAEENGDKIANGANDNATGTTTVLELARYFGKTKTNKRSIIFALFSAEEKGLLGSKHLAQKLKEANLNLYVMLNYEMVGVPLVDKDYLAYLTGYEESNMADVANSYAEGGTYAGFLSKAKEFNLFMRSDNYPFHEAFGVPSQTFSTFDFTNFNHYHKVGDEISEMDFGHMANLINKSIPVVEGIVNASTKEIRYN
ncbi:M20/M25/M40 family metallo-hydrolase [Zobellia galactanivorans]|uniref:M28 family metallopeptidase n=1 Tax=Zobellia galactanivorans (strain DSM 12802 / CCUG 47099 / CIP 106680 / NCIMB 13871 / Dsij) TaxID=63186 RepID=UPI0026E41BA6|nr:M28 family peptidase [Zobellia galactanivorans]MDO6809383.1 M20/M25/M40 family metallo-hydrolase [Zobellia galactanivorans]